MCVCLSATGLFLVQLGLTRGSAPRHSGTQTNGHSHVPTTTPLSFLEYVAYEFTEERAEWDVAFNCLVLHVIYFPSVHSPVTPA